MSFADLTKNMVIRAGATLYDAYASKSAFRAEVDLVIDVTGKILLTGSAVFAEAMRVDAYFYGDLSKIASGSGRFMFLFDMPGGPMRNLEGVSIYGLLDFGVVDQFGNRITSESLKTKYFKDTAATDTFSTAATSGGQSGQTFILSNTVSTGTSVVVKVTESTASGSTTVVLGADQYSLANGNTLTLNTNPSAGSRVAVEYTYKVADAAAPPRWPTASRSSSRAVCATTGSAASCSSRPPVRSPSRSRRPS